MAASSNAYMTLLKQESHSDLLTGAIEEDKTVLANASLTSSTSSLTCLLVGSEHIRPEDNAAMLASESTTSSTSFPSDSKVCNNGLAEEDYEVLENASVTSSTSATSSTSSVNKNMILPNESEQQSTSCQIVQAVDDNVTTLTTKDVAGSSYESIALSQETETKPTECQEYSSEDDVDNESSFLTVLESEEFQRDDQMAKFKLSDDETATQDSQSLHVLLDCRIMRYTQDDETSESDNTLANIYKDYEHLFKRDEIDKAFTCFLQLDCNADGYLAFNELKLMLEKLQVPQTHLAAKYLVQQVVGNRETINFCHVLNMLAEIRQFNSNCVEQPLTVNPLDNAKKIDVPPAGVHGAKRFFEAKIAQQLEQNNLKKLKTTNNVESNGEPNHQSQQLSTN